MKFDFKIVEPKTRSSILSVVNKQHDWHSIVDVASVSVQDLVDTVKGRSTYHIADPMDDVYTPQMFETNNIIMLADRVPGISTNPAFYSNLLRCHAIACDWWTWKEITELIPSIGKRLINLTGVNIWEYDDYRVKEEYTKKYDIVYAGPRDAFFHELRAYIQNTSFMDRNGNKMTIETIEDACTSNYGVLLAPNTCSSLWLGAMAHRSELVIHDFDTLASYALDPRGNSTTITSIKATQEELSGSTSFKRYIENFMDEFPALVNSLQDNPYRRPKGDTLINRLFSEINKSGY